MEKKIIAIVPAAGRGERFNSSVNKMFADVGGMPLLIYTLKKLNGITTITEIIPVLRQEDMDRGLELMKDHGIDKVNQVAAGGRERQDSIYNALKLINDDDCLVMVHDGARPIVSEILIKKILNETDGIDGIVPGIPVKETLKEVDKATGIVVSTVNREKFWTSQTPQIFPFKTIKKAYDNAYSEGFYSTDDAALVEKTGGKIKMIIGDPLNIKVTTIEDIDIVGFLLGKERRSP